MWRWENHLTSLSLTLLFLQQRCDCNCDMQMKEHTRRFLASDRHWVLSHTIPEQPHSVGAVSISILQRRKLRLQDGLESSGHTESTWWSKDANPAVGVQVRSPHPSPACPLVSRWGCHCPDHLTLIFVAYVSVTCLSH